MFKIAILLQRNYLRANTPADPLELPSTRSCQRHYPRGERRNCAPQITIGVTLRNIRICKLALLKRAIRIPSHEASKGQVESTRSRNVREAISPLLCQQSRGSD